MPREGRFFDLFRKSAELIVQGAHEFEKMLAHMDQIDAYARSIKEIEHQADLVTHQTMELLHKTFITPLDREDIHELITRMDDIIDFIKAASERIYLYDIRKMTPEAVQLAKTCTQSAECIQKIVNDLENLKNADEVKKLCVEINRLENEADAILRAGMAKLFKEEPDTRQLIKMKDIYELLETVTDRCEDVANVVEGIVLEYA
jgi:predicted phosphate transport protein (TIGR00153 family)